MKRQIISFALIIGIVSGIILPSVLFNPSFKVFAEDEITVAKGQSTEFKVEVDSDGDYLVRLTYKVISSQINQNEIRIKIDGKEIFEQGQNIKLVRPYENIPGTGLREGFIRKDKTGNELTPQQKVRDGDFTDYISDLNGFDDDNYKISLLKGIHSINVTAINEPLTIKSVVFEKVASLKPYSKPSIEEATQSITIQAEGAILKSDSMIVPYSDRSSELTQPQDATLIMLNIIGGNNWSGPGQWLEWNFDVPQKGTYTISLRYKQKFLSGSFVSRRISIDGEVPFAQFDNIRFDYDDKWQIKTPGADEPFMFNLDKGPHKIRIEATLGEMKDILDKSKACAYDLNNIYRKIVMYIGTTPDVNRDYQIEKVLPDVLKDISAQAKVLKQINDLLFQITGKRGTATVTIDTLMYTLEDFVEDPRKIPARLDGFKGNIGALAAWIYDLQRSPLELDFIEFTPTGKTVPVEKPSLLGSMYFGIRKFISSFLVDYTVIGLDNESKAEAVSVWVGSGRDNANIMREIITNEFTPKTGINVNLKLVSGQLLMATMAGAGPDVSLQNGGGDPVNFATRDAVQDLSKYEGFDEVAKRFKPSALVPFQFDGGTYALPESHTFPVMFYRKDIIDELGIKLPDTWEEAYDVIGILQKKNLEFAIPADMSGFGMFLYQNKGSYYSENGRASGLDSSNAIKAFEQYTKMFTSYLLPLKYDLANRFRTGEIPLAISDYSFANLLTVYAPELRGLWGFATVPGTKNADGTIDKSVAGGTSGLMMLKSAKNKKDAWAFMKWYSSDETQQKYGLALEALLGPAGRYATANVNVVNNLPWSEDNKKVLNEQWNYVKGIPEIPGGYFTSRHLENAFRRVINVNEVPRESMLDYVEKINKEIIQKRSDLGLPN